MKRHLRNWFRAAAVLAVGIGTVWGAGVAMDKHEVAQMTEKMQTVCMGRMLIDLPREADFALYGTWIDGFDIQTVQESADAFAARVAAREAEIRATPDRLGGSKNMESATEVKTESGLTGKTFVHSRYVREGTRARGLELERYRHEGVALEGHVHGHGISISLTAKKYDPAKVGDLVRMVGKLVANPENRIVTEPGFCIDRAYFRDPLVASQGERIRLTAGLPSHRDIEIHLYMTAGTKPAEQGLIERNTENNKEMSPAMSMRFTRLRAAPRTIGNLTGDELLLRVVEENFAVIFGFRWEVLGIQDNVFVPALGLKMVTGRSNEGPIPSSLSQAAALDLWDKIASSIRVRPTVAPAAREPEPTPLGSHAMAGDTCVQTGWWECNNGGGANKVLGGQRQYIRQGEQMPQALLLPPQTLWEKARGLQPSYESKSPTPWRLVDRRSERRRPLVVPLDQAKTAASTSVAPSSSAGAERSSVGAYAMTGNPCPASGWWRCQESDALDGTRWFAQGSLLPAATFTVPGRTFGLTSGAPKAMRRRGIWQLVRLAEANGLGEAAADAGVPQAGA